MMGDIIDAAYLHQMANPKEDTKKSEAIVDEAIAEYDVLVARINQKNVENKRQHFNDIKKDLEVKAEALVDKINAL